MERLEDIENTEHGMRRWFPLFTNGQYPDIDLLGVVVQCMEEIEKADQKQLKATLEYLNARFGQ